MSEWSYNVAYYDEFSNLARLVIDPNNKKSGQRPTPHEIATFMKSPLGLRKPQAHMIIV